MAFIILSLIFALLEWIAEHKQSRLGIYSTKPTMMLFLIAWVLLYADLLTDTHNFPLVWFLIGLAFCLGGDIFLMLPERFFLSGLISFLLGHIFYILGLWGSVTFKVSLLPGLMLAVVILSISLTLYRRLARGMVASENTRMRIPVAVYAFIISIMLYLALLTPLSEAWENTFALIVAAGALLFYVSDILNAWRRFISPFSNDRLLIMSTYHLGQIGIAVGATLQFTML